MSRHECRDQTITCQGATLHRCDRHWSAWSTHEERCEAAVAALTCYRCRKAAHDHEERN